MAGTGEDLDFVWYVYEGVERVNIDQDTGALTARPLAQRFGGLQVATGKDPGISFSANCSLAMDPEPRQPDQLNKWNTGGFPFPLPFWVLALSTSSRSLGQAVTGSASNPFLLHELSGCLVWIVAAVARERKTAN